MKILHLVAVATLFGLLQDSPAPKAGAVGVLVGLHVWGTAGELTFPPTSLEGGSLKTLWIPISDGSSPSSRDVVSVPDLVLPRRSGFWRAGLLGTCVEEPRDSIDGERRVVAVTVSDHLWFTPATANPMVTVHRAYSTAPVGTVGPCRTGEMVCHNDARTGVQWIWPEFVSLKLGGEYSCGMHPDSDINRTLRQVDEPTRPSTLPEVLGPDALVRLRAAYESAKREYLRTWPRFPEGEAKFDPSSWHIEREPGRWRLAGWTETMRIYGYGFDYTADYDLSKVTGRRGDDQQALAQVKRNRPDVEDAHSGPSGWVLAIRDSELLVLPPARSGARALSVPISDFEKVVMVEWATGPHVQRWSQEVATARSIKPVVVPQ